MCGEPPLESDWIGIYPCDAETLVATQEWWDAILLNPGYIGEPGATMEDYGFVPGTEYPLAQQAWWSYTCSSPGEGIVPCQQLETTEWPSQGSVTIDPAMAPQWAFWGDSMDKTLAPGCYKVLLNRNLPRESISPPPIPMVCPGQAWQTANEFTVPSRAS